MLVSYVAFFVLSGERPVQVVVVGVDGDDPEPVLDVVLEPQDLEAPCPGVDDVVERAPLRPDAAAVKLPELDLEELDGHGLAAQGGAGRVNCPGQQGGVPGEFNTSLRAHLQYVCEIDTDLPDCSTSGLDGGTVAKWSSNEGRCQNSSWSSL